MNTADETGLGSGGDSVNSAGVASGRRVDQKNLRGFSPLAWRPLASSPSAFTAFAAELGVDTARFRFVDGESMLSEPSNCMHAQQEWIPRRSHVWLIHNDYAPAVLGMDPELLTLIPGIPLALIVIYPNTDAANGYFEAAATPIKNGTLAGCFTADHVDGDIAEDREKRPDIQPAPWFVQQLVGGTCGTIAVLHALANTAASMRSSFKCDKSLSRPLHAFRWSELENGDDWSSDGGRDPRSLITLRSHRLLRSSSLRAAHDRCAEATSSQLAEAGIRQGRHYVTLICVGRELVLLDGRRQAPLRLGPPSGSSTTDDAFLPRAAAEIKRLIGVVTAESPAATFSVLALVETTADDDRTPPAYCRW